MTEQMSLEQELGKARRGVLVEWGAGVVLIVAAVGLLFMEQDAAAILLSAAALLFAGVWLTYLTITFPRTLANHEELRSARARWFAFVRKTLIAAGIFCVLWSPLQISAHWSFYSREPHRAVVGIGAMFGILAMIWVLNARKQREIAGR